MALFKKLPPALCQFCGAAPADIGSHVVPRFVFKYIRQNSPNGDILYSWGRLFKHEQISGPYLCKHHDNDVFQQWETYFCNNVFANPLGAAQHWPADDSVRFALSLCYRYPIHDLQVSPHDVNVAGNELYRNLARAALDDLALVGNQIFIYPHVVRPILNTCAFVNRVNSFLSLSIHGNLCNNFGPGLPQVYVVRIPKILFVFSDVDLTALGDPRVANLLCLSPGSPFNPDLNNGNLLNLLTGYINAGINETMAHQKTLGWWRRYLIGRDMAANPHKMVYQARGWDQQLTSWQQMNCPH